jgi:hypothetical protein
MIIVVLKLIMGAGSIGSSVERTRSSFIWALACLLSVPRLTARAGVDRSSPQSPRRNWPAAAGAGLSFIHQQSFVACHPAARFAHDFNVVNSEVIRPRLGSGIEKIGDKP